MANSDLMIQAEPAYLSVLTAQRQELVQQLAHAELELGESREEGRRQARQLKLALLRTDELENRLLMLEQEACTAERKDSEMARLQQLHQECRRRSNQLQDTVSCLEKQLEQSEKYSRQLEALLLEQKALLEQAVGRSRERIDLEERLKEQSQVLSSIQQAYRSLRSSHAKQVRDLEGSLTFETENNISQARSINKFKGELEATCFDLHKLKEKCQHLEADLRIARGQSQLMDTELQYSNDALSKTRQELAVQGECLKSEERRRADLEQMVHQCQTQLSSLKSDLNQLQIEKDKTLLSLRESEHRRAQQKQLYQQTRKGFQDLEAVLRGEAERLKERCEAGGVRLREMQMTLSAGEQRFLLLREKHEQSQRQRKQCLLRRTQLQSDLHFCKSELGLAKDRQQKLGLQLSNVESQLQLVRNDNESLKQANRELRGALTEEQSRVEKQEGELKEMQNFKKALELKSLNLQKLRQEQEKCREQMNQLKERLGDTNRKCKNLEDDRLVQAALNQKLKEQLKGFNQAKAELQRLRKTQKTMQRRCQVAEGKYLSLSQAQEKARLQAESLGKGLAQAEQKMQAMDEQAKQLRSVLKEQKEQGVSQSKRLEQLEMQVKLKNLSFGAEVQSKNKLLKMVKQLSQREVELNRQHSEFVYKIRQVELMVADQNAELERGRQVIREQSQELKGLLDYSRKTQVQLDNINEMRQQVDVLRQDKNRLEEERQEAVAQYQSLQKEISEMKLGEQAARASFVQQLEKVMFDQGWLKSKKNAEQFVLDSVKLVLDKVREQQDEIGRLAVGLRNCEQKGSAQRSQAQEQRVAFEALSLAKGKLELKFSKLTDEHARLRLLADSLEEFKQKQQVEKYRAGLQVKKLTSKLAEREIQLEHLSEQNLQLKDQARKNAANFNSAAQQHRYSIKNLQNNLQDMRNKLLSSEESFRIRQEEYGKRGQQARRVEAKLQVELGLLRQDLKKQEEQLEQKNKELQQHKRQTLEGRRQTEQLGEVVRQLRASLVGSFQLKYLKASNDVALASIRDPQKFTAFFVDKMEKINQTIEQHVRTAYRLEAERNSAREQAKQSAGEAEQLREEVARWRKGGKEMAGREAALISELQAIKQRQAEDQGKLKEAIEKCQKSQATINQLKSELKCKEIVCNKLANDAEHAKADLDDAVGRQSLLHRELESAVKERERLKKQLSAVNQQLTACNIEQTTLLANLQQQQFKLREEQSARSKGQFICESLRQKVGELLQKQQDLNREKAEAMANADNQVRQHKEKESRQVTRLLQEKQVLQATVQKLIEERDSLKAQEVSLLQKIQLSDQRCQQQRLELAQLQKLKEGLGQDKRRPTSFHRLSYAELESSRRASMMLGSEGVLERLQSENRELKGKLNEKRLECEMLREQLDNLMVESRRLLERGRNQIDNAS